MFNLPDELWIKVVNLLDLNSVISLAQTNKYFFYITKYNEYWEVNYNLDKYDKKIKFIDHCYNIKYLQDYTSNFKYYISEYHKLLTHNLTTIKIRAFNQYDLELVKYNKNIKNLDIKSCYNIHNKHFLEVLDGLKNLRYLSISNSVIDDNIIPIINNYKLKTLTLEACVSLNRLDLLKIENLKTLRIISHQYLDNSTINNLVYSLKKLEKLTLSITNIDIRTMYAISKVGANLKVLDISYPQNTIDNVAIFAISKGCLNLENLNINGTEVSDSGIIYLSDHCPKITRLSLAGTYISNTSFINIARKYPKLTFLESAFNSIDNYGVEYLLCKCKNIKYLNILNNSFTVEYLNTVYRRIRENNFS